MAVSCMETFLGVIEETDLTTVKAAKDRNRKIVGLLCSYVPLELLDAAGVLPYRIKGVPGRDIGSGTAYLSTRLCTFCRNALTLALEGDLSYLDGLLGTNSCDPVRRTSHNWAIKCPPSFNEFIHVPRVCRDENISAFTAELARLKESLENWLGLEIGDAQLKAAIEKRNTARSILRELDVLRSHERPRLKGSEMLAVSVAYHQMPVDDFIEAAETLLEERRGADGEPGKVRVLLTGGMLDDPGYVKFIEDQGLDVVADAVCFGFRSYADDIALDRPPLDAISERYMNHFHCARMGESFPLRWERILDLYKERNADGIIFQRLMFCQLWGVDMHIMPGLCEKSNIPLLYLEREYGFFSTGQLKTRLQAFTELIADRKMQGKEASDGHTG